MTDQPSRRPSWVAATDRRIGHFLATRRGRRRPVRFGGGMGDEGFALLESLVAIGLISVVMAAFTTFFVNSVAATGQQRATQAATEIANSTVDTVRAIPSSDPVNGHDSSSVTTQFNAASSTVTPWLSTMVAATDPTAAVGSGPTAALPTVAVVQTVNSVAYSVNVYLGTCVIPTGVTVNAGCDLGAASTGIQYLRAVVAVTWTGAHCPPTRCTYLTSTLLSTVDDPLFNLNQSPPAAPVMTNPGAQVSAVGDTVNLVAAIVAVPTYRVALTTGTLPAGLFLNTATGAITGTPTAITASTALTLTLTDGFGRASAISFTWTVLAALTATAPANQANITGTAITALVISASGGSPGYTWSDPIGSLPPGLSVTTVNNQASLTGTPTTVGTFPVTLTVTDSKSRTTTVSFSWTVDYPPFAATNPGAQTSTVGRADSLTLSVTGGSGFFAWTGSLPAGLTMTAAGTISGSPTTAGVTSVTLVATDSRTSIQRSVTFSWTVYSKPTVTSPGNQSVTIGISVSLQLATTCPNAPCTYTLNNGPATLAINGTGLMTGTITSAAQTFNAVTVTVTDNSGAPVSSATFTFKVNAVPTLTNPGNQVAPLGTADSLDVATLVTGGTTPLTYSASNLPSWLTLNASTGMISGTAPGTAVTTTGVVLTVRDAVGVTASTASFSWIVGGPPSAPLSVAVVNGDTTVTASWASPASTNGAAITGYTATLSPGGASCTTTGALTCVISALTDGLAYSLTVTATNSLGAGPASSAVTAIPYPAVMSAANGLTLWLDGADPTVMLGSPSCTGAVTTTTVGCWKDKSGQGENFIQSTSANRPGLGSWNGLSAANFADSGDVLNSVDPFNTYQTVFVAANVTNPAGAGAIVDLFGQAGLDFNVRVGSGVARNAPNLNDWSSLTAGPLNWANGVPGVNVGQPGQVITSDQALTAKLFSASLSNTFLNRGVVGQVGDVITFNRALTTAQRRAVEEYLANKWGVAITPQAPATVTAVVASTTSATVSWPAPVFNGGAPVTSYTVTSAPGGKTCSTAGLSCTVTGLTHNTTYRFTVTATNSVGLGPVSALSNSVTP